MSNVCVNIPLTTVRRLASVASIAASNPGDGTKRLYGDDTFIDDGSEIDGVHPDVIRTAAKQKIKKATVEDAKDDRDAPAIIGNGRESVRNAIVEDDGDDDKTMAYLEDTEARG